MHFVDPSAAVAVYTDTHADTHTNTLPYTSLADAHRGIKRALVEKGPGVHCIGDRFLVGMKIIILNWDYLFVHVTIIILVSNS